MATSKTLKADGSAGDAYVQKNFSTVFPWKLDFDVYVPAATLTALLGASDTFTADLADVGRVGLTNRAAIWWEWDGSNWHWGVFHATATPTVALPDTSYHVTIEYVGNSTAGTTTYSVDGVSIASYSLVNYLSGLQVGAIGANSVASEFYYMDNVVVEQSGVSIFSDDFEGGSPVGWTSTTGSASVVDFDMAGGGGGGGGGTPGRVLIAFDDGPLVASPTWTRIDDTNNLVSGYDVHSGKQTDLDNTDTGTATVYINDTNGLFDPANTGSPYFGKLDGKQIMLQLYNPVTATWVPQFRGHINDYGFDINPATNSDGTLVVATVQIECVDIFDYLEGYQLTSYPIDGDSPPAGSEGTIFYEDTAGTIDDRFVQVLTDVGLDSTRYVVFTGNVSGQETKYDPGDSALQALRDAADAELPTIANIYVDKQGRFVFHGRESRFDPETVEATTTPDIWDFNRWKVGDGIAIVDDPTRAQIRVLSYSRPRSEVINSAIAWPQHDSTEDSQIATQAYQDATSISTYGFHGGPPMSDLIIKEGTTTGNNKWVETAKYAELIVKNHKDPRNTISQLTAKTIAPTDPRATATWAAICGAEISDIINVRVGYPNGVGIDSDTPGDGEDFYLEGFSLRVRYLNTTYDMVEVDWEVSPAVWSMDTHGVFA